MKKLLILVLVFASCTASLETETTIDRDFSSVLGKRITVEGTAVNTKLGAVVVTKSNVSIWVDELDSWPPEYYSGEETGRAVTVTGIITETYDLPVYIGRNSEPQGRFDVSSTEGTDDESRDTRYVIKDASWSLLPN